MPSALKNRPVKEVLSKRVTLDDGLQTTIHIVSYKKSRVKPHLVLFEHGIPLLNWCKSNKVNEAIVGGFFLRKHGKPLGEMWINGIQKPNVPFVAPWNDNRGSIHIDNDDIAINFRDKLPATPTGHLLQAGPLLVRNGQSLLATGNDHEGFSTAAHQFDSDITIGRHPRAAIGSNDTHIFSVVCDGRNDADMGMTLAEMAKTMLNLGCTDALNLDGGGSASLVTDGALLNTPRGDGREYPQGRPIFTAITFEPSDSY